MLHDWLTAHCADAQEHSPGLRLDTWGWSGFAEHCVDVHGYQDIVGGYNEFCCQCWHIILSACRKFRKIGVQTVSKEVLVSCVCSSWDAAVVPEDPWVLFSANICSHNWLDVPECISHACYRCALISRAHAIRPAAELVYTFTSSSLLASASLRSCLRIRT